MWSMIGTMFIHYDHDARLAVVPGRVVCRQALQAQSEGPPAGGDLLVQVPGRAAGGAGADVVGKQQLPSDVHLGQRQKIVSFSQFIKLISIYIYIYF